jgi:hypothetical protein
MCFKAYVHFVSLYRHRHCIILVRVLKYSIVHPMLMFIFNKTVEHHFKMQKIPVFIELFYYIDQSLLPS